MAMAKSKGPARAAMAVASLINEIVYEMARDGMWAAADVSATA
jgi:hypothetical protein